MKQSKIRFIYPQESAQAEQWLRLNPVGDFDPEVLTYPTLQTVCCYRDEMEAYLPMHRAMIFETVGFRPDLGDFHRAAAVRDLTKAGELLASSHGIREIYFLGGADGMGELAVNQAGFEKVEVPVYRLKLK